MMRSRLHAIIIALGIWLTPFAALSGSPFQAFLQPEAQGVRLLWSSQLGCTYQAQWSSSLTSWQDLGTAFTGNGASQSLLDLYGTHDRRFYRVTRTCSGVPASAINVPYTPPPGGDAALSKMDIYYVPDGQAKRLMVFVHGGGWVMGDKSNLAGAPSLVPWFRNRGFVVAAPNFRLANAPGGPRLITYADQATDIAHALAWLAQNAAGYGVTESGVLLVGYSSGAHLVALLAADARHLDGAGLSLGHLYASISLDVHAYDVPYALQLMQGSGIQNNIPTVEYLFGQTTAEQLFGSPITYAATAPVPPNLIISADPSSVPGTKGYIAAQTSQRYVQFLTSRGRRATWNHFDNETHPSLVSNFGTAGDGPTAAVATFLDALLPP